MPPTKKTETEFEPTGDGPCRLIGSGGFADVYQCEDKALGGKIAVKLYHQRRLDSKDRRERFKRIADILGKVHHQGLPTFHGARLVSPETEWQVGEPGDPCPQLIKGKTTFGYMVFEFIG